MTSPDLINQLKASRPAAPTALRARVRDISAQEAAPPASFWPKLRLPVRRIALVAVPAAMAVAIASAGVLGLARSDGLSQAQNAPTPVLVANRLIPAGTPGTLVASQTMYAPTTLPRKEVEEGSIADPQYLSGRAAAVDILPGQQITATDFAADTRDVGSAATVLDGAQAQDSVIGPDTGRAQRISATMTVEVADSDGVSQAAQKALALTESLGGHVVSANVSTGDEGSAVLTLRIPVENVQDAIVRLSALGRIVSQQVTIDDLQATLDTLERRERSVRAQIALVTARLDSETLDAPTRAQLEARLKTLRSELRQLRRDTAATSAEARMATIQMSVVTPDGLGAVPVPSRLDRSLDEALNILVWEGVVALAILIVAAPFALVIAVTWIGRKLYRRREEEKLLAT